MSPPLETVLMMQYKLSFRESRKVVAEGRSNLGQEGSSDWDEQLLGECAKLIESKQNDLEEAGTTGRGRRGGEEVGSDKALHAPATASTSCGDEHSDCASTESRHVKKVASWNLGIQKSTGGSSLSLILSAPTRNRSYIGHYIAPGDDRSCVVDEKDVGDNHSEATAGDMGCNASIAEISITSRQDDNFIGEGNRGHLCVDEMTTRNEVLVKQAMELNKTQNQIKKTDEESTVTTVESSLSDIPAIIYVVRDISHLNRNTKNRSVLNRGKQKNLLGRIRQSFSVKPTKGSDMLDEDSPEAYENTFVSI